MSSPHPDSKWTHSICGPCWREQEGERRPLKLSDADPEVCCFCGKGTVEGIYYRADPAIVHPDTAA